MILFYVGLKDIEQSIFESGKDSLVMGKLIHIIELQLWSILKGRVIGVLEGGRWVH